MVNIEAIDDPAQLRTVCRVYEASHRVLVNRLESLARRLAEIERAHAAQEWPEYIEGGKAKSANVRSSTSTMKPA